MLEPLKQIDAKALVDSLRDDPGWATRRIKVLTQNSEYVVILGRGPTRGYDFHINPWEEIFYQLEGELKFHSVDGEGQRQVRTLRSGEWLFLPVKVPHAPRRPDASSWTLVVERTLALLKEGHDGFAWYCERCNNKLYEIVAEGHSGPGTPNTALPKANELLKADESLRTCSRCGEVQPPPP